MQAAVAVAAVAAGNGSQPAALPAGLAAWAAGGAAPGLLVPLGALGAAGAAGNAALAAAVLGAGPGGAGRPLLLGLCAAELLLLLGCLPARLAAAAAARGPGAFLCRTGDWALHACLLAKSWALAALGQAGSRRLPAARPAALAAVAALLWAPALLLPLPLLLFTRLRPGAARPRCLFQPPPAAAAFVEVFGKAFPALAFLLPACLAWAAYGRALRRGGGGGGGGRRRRAGGAGPSGRRLRWALLALSLLFQALCLPLWGLWLWERRPGAPAPPAALAVLAQALLFAHSSLSPGVLLAASAESRRGLRRAWLALRRGRAAGGPAGPVEGAQALRDVGAAGGEQAPPDVELFWQERRKAADGEESDPVPWEHQGGP
ncbi:G-protein coupled receptor 151-like [Apteryx mantelli]|uniref:G-protein coupled receptor 151-like n=1 Tax=Apteryx mantelli TaxID=2696672 RepID=A0ABM4EKY8_9AVES